MSLQMNHLESVKVKYWWTEDGEAELCVRKEGALEKDTECYHCGAKLKKGTKVSILFPLGEVEEYIMCVSCANKSTKINIAIFEDNG